MDNNVYLQRRNFQGESSSVSQLMFLRAGICWGIKGLCHPWGCGLCRVGDELPGDSILPCLPIGNAAYSWVNSCGNLIYVHSLGGKGKRKNNNSSYLNIHHSSRFAGTIFQVISLSNLDKNMYFPMKDKAQCHNINTWHRVTLCDKVHR